MASDVGWRTLAKAKPKADSDEMNRLKTVLGLATSVISTEHFFSVSLSAMPTTRRFFGDGNAKDKADVEKSLNIATLLSLGSSALISAYLRKPEGFIASAGLSAYLYWQYQRILKDNKI